MSATRLVILDKNFLQSEDHTTPRLRALARCGCEFVLIDTLIYELCSDARLTNLWASIQRKLFPFADRLHLWSHSSDLLRCEVSSNSPVSGPEDEEVTQRFRDWFRSGQVYVPSNLKEIVGAARQQREIDTMEKVAPMARTIGGFIAEKLRDSGTTKVSKGDFERYMRDNQKDACLMQSMLRGSYGNPELPESYIPNAESRVTPDWFAFHSARATLALIRIFLQKYGLTEKPGKAFPNTKLDLEYLALLHYADAIASDETAGDMADMCEWLYGSAKKRISSASLFASLPHDDAIRLDAYLAWDSSGRRHGHDLDDWLSAEREAFAQVWDRLGTGGANK